MIPGGARLSLAVPLFPAWCSLVDDHLNRQLLNSASISNFLANILPMIHIIWLLSLELDTTHLKGETSPMAKRHELSLHVTF